MCYYRHLCDCVCVGTADGKLVCFELTEGLCLSVCLFCSVMCVCVCHVSLCLNLCLYVTESKKGMHKLNQSGLSICCLVDQLINLTNQIS